MSKKSIRFFINREMRAVWDDENNCWRFSATDVVRTINDEPDYTKAGNSFLKSVKHTSCFEQHFYQNIVINLKRNSRSLRCGNKEKALISILPTSLLQ